MFDLISTMKIQTAISFGHATLWLFFPEIGRWNSIETIEQTLDEQQQQQPQQQQQQQSNRTEQSRTEF